MVIIDAEEQVKVCIANRDGKLKSLTYYSSQVKYRKSTVEFCSEGASPNVKRHTYTLLKQKWWTAQKL